MAVKTDPTESLRRVPIFGGLDKKELETLAKLVKEQQYGAGATIVKAGAAGTACTSSRKAACRSSGMGRRWPPWVPASSSAKLPCWTAVHGRLTSGPTPTRSA